MQTTKFRWIILSDQGSTAHSFDPLFQLFSQKIPTRQFLELEKASRDKKK